MCPEYFRKLTRLLLSDIDLIYGNQSDGTINVLFFNLPEESEFLDIYIVLKKRLEKFFSNHGSYYESLIARVLLTEFNVKSQFYNGVNGILQSFNNSITPLATVALFSFFLLMVKTCHTRDLGEFTESLVQWNCSIFEGSSEGWDNLSSWALTIKSREQRIGRIEHKIRCRQTSI